MKLIDTKTKKLPTAEFISHMVQMKLNSMSSGKTLKHYLYPTWFRWNIFKSALLSVFLLIYIPHGSDETFYLSALQKRDLSIYIPHGSDETWDG